MKINKILTIILLIFIILFAVTTAINVYLIASGKSLSYKQNYTLSENQIKLQNLYSELDDEIANKKRFENIKNFDEVSTKINDIINYDKLTPTRFVKVDIAFSENNIKAKLEEHNIQASSFDEGLTLIAPFIGSEECEIIKTFLASKCLIYATQSKTELINENVNIGLVTLLMIITTKQQNHGFFKIEGEVFFTDVEALSSKANIIIQDLNEAKNFRSSIYEKANKYCETLLSKIGNCSFHQLRIDAKINSSRRTDELLHNLRSTGLYGYLSNVQ
jgi:flagellar basal body-associated protein FliL